MMLDLIPGSSVLEHGFLDIEHLTKNFGYWSLELGSQTMDPDNGPNALYYI